MINSDMSPPTSPDVALEVKSAEQVAAFYQSIDWALDISKARFAGFAFYGGPPVRLIRRDPDSQVVVTRDRVMGGEWRNLDLSRTFWPTALETFLIRGDPDTVLVAPKAAKNYADLKKGLDLLREAGIAE